MRILLTAVVLLLAGAQLANAGFVCNTIMGQRECQKQQEFRQFKEDLLDLQNESSDEDSDATALESPERVQAWEHDCKPRRVVGADGIGRYVYAHSGCDVRPIK